MIQINSTQCQFNEGIVSGCWCWCSCIAVAQRGRERTTRCQVESWKSFSSFFFPAGSSHRFEIEDWRWWMCVFFSDLFSAPTIIRCWLVGWSSNLFEEAEWRRPHSPFCYLVIRFLWGRDEHRYYYDLHHYFTPCCSVRFGSLTDRSAIFISWNFLWYKVDSIRNQCYILTQKKSNRCIYITKRFYHTRTLRPRGDSFCSLINKKI